MSEKIVSVILTMFRNYIYTISCAVLASSVAQATVIALTADVANSSAPAFGSVATGVTTDTFAFDPFNPTAALPVLAFGGTNTFHGAEPNAGDVILALDAGGFVVGAQNNIVFDLYGRDVLQARDDNFSVELFDTAGSSLGLIENNAIADGAVPHARVDFGDIAVGTEIGSVIVTGFDSEPSSDVNNFTVQEVRLSAIPEPSSTLLMGLASLGFLVRRRR